LGISVLSITKKIDEKTIDEFLATFLENAQGATFPNSVVDFLLRNHNATAALLKKNENPDEN